MAPRSIRKISTMKIIISFLASALLTGLALAQDESPAPEETTPTTATEEKASATIEETPAPTPMESVTPAPTEKKAAPTIATSPEATASPAAKKEAVAATAKTTAAAAINTKGMSPKELENAWEAAIAKHDLSTIEGMLAPDFMGVSSKNKFISRNDLLGEFKRDKDTYKTAKNEKLNVKMFGKDVAVVTGRAREVGTGKDGKKFDRTFLFTDTWVMRAGKWQCVASQATKIKG